MSLFLVPAFFASFARELGMGEGVKYDQRSGWEDLEPLRGVVVDRGTHQRSLRPIASRLGNSFVRSYIVCFA